MVCGILSLDSDGGWEDAEPELYLKEVLEMLSPVAAWAVWGQQELRYVEFSSHGWLCQAALLKMCPIENGLFLANPKRMWESSAQGPLFLSLDGGSPAVTLDVRSWMWSGLSLGLGFP